MKHQVFGIVAGVSALFMTSGLMAGEKSLVKWGADASILQKQWRGKVKYEKLDSKLCGIVDNKNTIVSKKYIPVEVGKKYTLSGTFKSLGEAPSRVYYGFICYDNKKRYVAHYYSNVILGSATTLAQECKKGDKTIIIKANKKWKKNHAIAFNVKDDFSDLPNRDIIYKITKVTPKDGNMELQLSAPARRTYPAETKVRMHSASFGLHIYTTIVGAKIPNTWETYSQSVSLATPGEMGWKFLRPGTAFVKIVILANYAKTKDEKITFTDLSLKVSE